MECYHMKRWSVTMSVRQAIMYYTELQPVFDGDDLVAKGVQMEAMSVEDKGEDIKFNVFVYNVQDGVKIDYETGDSEADSSVQVTTENSKASQKYHTNQNSSNNSKNNSE